MLQTQFNKHIEYTTVDGKLWRVMRPFNPGQHFLIPMVSAEEEIKKDKEYLMKIRKSGNDVLPQQEDPNDGYDRQRESFFSGNGFLDGELDA